MVRTQHGLLPGESKPSSQLCGCQATQRGDLRFCLQPTEVPCMTTQSHTDVHPQDRHLPPQGPIFPQRQTHMPLREPDPQGHVYSLRAWHLHPRTGRSLLRPPPTQSHTHTHACTNCCPVTHCAHMSHLPNTPSLPPGSQPPSWSAPPALLMHRPHKHPSTPCPLTQLCVRCTVLPVQFSAPSPLGGGRGIQENKRSRLRTPTMYPGLPNPERASLGFNPKTIARSNLLGPSCEPEGSQDDCWKAVLEETG